MFVSAFLLYPNFGLTTYSITTHLPFFSLSYRWRELVARAHLVSPNLSKPFYNSSLVTTFPFSRRYIPPLKVASDSWVCVKGDVILYCLWPKA